MIAPHHHHGRHKKEEETQRIYTSGSGGKRMNKKIYTKLF
jgi:hypothetical protein